MSRGKNAEESDDGNDGWGTFKYNPINNNSNLKMVDYLGSEHAKSLQQSQYIKFENDVKRMM